MWIMILLIVCVLLAFIATKSKKDNKILQRCKDGKYFYETVEETLHREKTTKIIRYVICYTFLGVLAICMIMPFYWMIITSLKSDAEISLTYPTFFPHHFEWDNYRYIFDGKFQRAESKITNPNAPLRFDLWNTLIVGIFSTIGTLVTTVMAAFAFSRIKFPGRELIFTVFLATMMIPGEMMVITNFITVSKLKGMNTYWAMIVP